MLTNLGFAGVSLCAHISLIIPSVWLFWGKQHFVVALVDAWGCRRRQGYSDTCRLMPEPPRFRRTTPWEKKRKRKRCLRRRWEFKRMGELKVSAVMVSYFQLPTFISTGKSPRGERRRGRRGWWASTRQGDRFSLFAWQKWLSAGSDLIIIRLHGGQICQDRETQAASTATISGL